MHCTVLGIQGSNEIHNQIWWASSHTVHLDMKKPAFNGLNHLSWGQTPEDKRTVVYEAGGASLEDLALGIESKHSYRAYACNMHGTEPICEFLKEI